MLQTYQIGSRLYKHLQVYKMTSSTQKLKKSIVKILGINTSFNFIEPYLKDEESQAGGTGFFVDPKIFGPNFPVNTKNKRFVLTNFHVVEDLTSDECILKQPCLGNSAITAKVCYVVPNLDVAILIVDPFKKHPMWFDQANLPDFMEKIPNLNIQSEHTVKGNSQAVKAIGFPNLSNDYQICSGVISGRAMGMIQLNISFNGGNSGGPLMLKNKVIGICTASIVDSEALGLAMPIHKICRFFKYWTDYKQRLLRTPSWGIFYKHTTPDYLASKNIQHYQGCLVKKTLKKMVLKENHIIMGIKSDNQHYNVDNFGLVQVEWTDKRVPIDNLEFMLSLNPQDIRIQYFNNKKNNWTDKVIPKVFDFKIRKRYPSWEKIDYCIVGGVVFMELCINHLEEDEDEETYAGHQTIHLLNHMSETMSMQPVVVVTHMELQSHVSNQKNLNTFDRIVKINNKKIKTVQDIQRIISNSDDKYIKIETQNDKHIFCVNALETQEKKDLLKLKYPVEKLSLLKKKRKFVEI